MKKKLLWTAAVIGLALPLGAAPLTESTFTEVVKDVKIVANVSKSATPALPNDLLKAPDRVRTGPASRAELTAPDHTITRVGANTVFSYADSGRTLNLDQGSLLFHAPKGIGGGTIKSGGVVAAVLGTTLIVSATTDGGFKVILLEGSGKVTLPNGKSVTLKAGQLVFVAPNGTELSAVLDINLDKLVAGSLLVNGFTNALPSQPLIRSAVARQNNLLASGGAVDTGVSANNATNAPSLALGLNSLDHGTYQNAAHPPLSAQKLANFFNPQPAVAVFGAPGGRGFIPLGF